MGWLEGALRLMPSWETRIGNFTIPNPFYAGVLPAGLAFSVLYAYPWIEARLTGDRREHHVLDRPRDRPVRTALGVAALTFFTVLGLAGSNDVLAVAFGTSVNALTYAFRVALFVAPVVTGVGTYKLCRELQARAERPAVSGDAAGRTPAGRPAPARPHPRG
jgi:ubiquinol-cytochrome c reductase cytochrome b subunit